MSLKTWILKFICVHRFRGFMIFSLWGNDMISSIICSSHGCFGSYGSNGSHQFFFSPLLPCQGHQLLVPDISDLIEASTPRPLWPAFASLSILRNSSCIVLKGAGIPAGLTIRTFAIRNFGKGLQSLLRAFLIPLHSSHWKLPHFAFLELALEKLRSC